MVSERKRAANRRNAQKSTGPKTEAGKNKVKFNALTHGLTARTIVLPHEDADAYQKRLDDWLLDMNPRTGQETYLVDRLVRISWQLDRADFHERARLTGKIERMREQRGRDRSVPDLLNRLLSIPQDRSIFRLPSKDDPPPREDAADLLSRLQSTAEGCQALLDEWEGLRSFLIRQKAEPAPLLPDQNLVGCCRVVRLLGKRDPEAKIMATIDRRFDALLQIQSLAFDETARKILTCRFEDEDQNGAPRQEEPQLPMPDPDLVKRLNEQLWSLVDENYRKLQKLMASCEAKEAVEDVSDEEAAFDDSPEGERLHRYQTHWARMFQRTLDEIHRLHDRPADEADAAEPERESAVGSGQGTVNPAEAGAAAETAPCPGAATPPCRTVAAETVADQKPQPAPAAASVAKNSPKQSHREIKSLCRSRCYDRREHRRPAALATLGRLLDAASAPTVQPFRAAPLP